MTAESPGVRAAVVQAASIAFDRDASLAKADRLTSAAAAQGARLALFPEAFITGYPRGMDFGAVVGSRTPEGREAYRRSLGPIAGRSGV